MVLGMYVLSRYEALSLVLLRQMGTHHSQLKPYLDLLPIATTHPAVWADQDLALLREFVCSMHSLVGTEQRTARAPWYLVFFDVRDCFL